METSNKRPADAGATECPAVASAPMRLRWEDWLGAAILALLVLMTFCNVLVRYLSSQSFAWTEEISVFLLLAMTLLGVAATVAAGDSIRIDCVLDRLGLRGQRAVHVMAALLGVLVFGLLGFLYALTGWTEWTYDETTSGMGAPRWAYTIWLMLLALAVTLRYAQACWRAYKRGGV